MHWDAHEEMQCPASADTDDRLCWTGTPPRLHSLSRQVERQLVRAIRTVGDDDIVGRVSLQAVPDVDKAAYAAYIWTTTAAVAAILVFLAVLYWRRAHKPTFAMLERLPMLREHVLGDDSAGATDGERSVAV
jgi:hypothetical protein